MFLIILIVSVGVLLIWLLTAPIRIVIDTEHNQYFFNFLGVGVAKVRVPSDEFCIELRILFWSKCFYPFRSGIPKPKGSERRKRKRKRFPLSWRRALALLKSFKVNAWTIDIDTDDYIRNSLLFPVFRALTNGHRRFIVNYNGEIKILVDIENRGYRILKALF